MRVHARAPAAAPRSDAHWSDRRARPRHGRASPAPSRTRSCASVRLAKKRRTSRARSLSREHAGSERMGMSLRQDTRVRSTSCKRQLRLGKWGQRLASHSVQHSSERNGRMRASAAQDETMRVNTASSVRERGARCTRSHRRGVPWLRQRSPQDKGGRARTYSAVVRRVRHVRADGERVGGVRAAAGGVGVLGGDGGGARRGGGPVLHELRAGEEDVDAVRLLGVEGERGAGGVGRER
eukprot:718483-Pleurochrysis_carterae.AAC.1